MGGTMDRLPGSGRQDWDLAFVPDPSRPAPGFSVCSDFSGTEPSRPITTAAALSGVKGNVLDACLKSQLHSYSLLHLCVIICNKSWIECMVHVILCWPGQNQQNEF